MVDHVVLKCGDSEAKQSPDPGPPVRSPEDPGTPEPGTPVDLDVVSVRLDPGLIRT